MWSHLLQMRGLKRIKPEFGLRFMPVASFTDAWIETDNAVKLSGLEVSHLLQMRGLKPKEYCDPHQLLSRIFYRCVD